MTLIDLHTHSTASDGTDTPEELVDLVAKAGIKSFALTDHDTINGFAQAKLRADTLGIKVIPACEIAVEYMGHEVHLLAYWVNTLSPTFLNFLSSLRELREQRNQKILQNLQKLNFKIEMEDVRRKASGNVGRPHFARVLVEKGYAADIYTAFAVYLGRNGSAYSPRELYPLEQGLEKLVQEGATVVMAHPCLSLSQSKEDWDKLMRRLADIGLSGVEAYHSSNTAEQVRLCVDMAKAGNLVLTGGSDYHGLVKPDVHLGIGSLNMRLQEYLLHELQKRRQADGLVVE